jgi:tetratricopeptide (TPR) repeat protein
MKKILLIFILQFACAAWIFSEQKPEDMFSQANQLYQKDQYQEAINLYNSILQKGMVSFDVYFNLGNAYYRTQRPGLALVNYERALRIKPRDSDVRSNIEFVTAAMKLPDRDLSEIMLDFFENMMSLNESAALSSLFLILLMAGLSAYLFIRDKKLIVLSAVLLAGFVCASGLFAFKYTSEVKTLWAVTVKSPAEVRNGPGTENSVGFTLPEGRKVSIIGEKDNWYAIGVKEEGLKGWIEKSYLEVI